MISSEPLHIAQTLPEMVVRHALTSSAQASQLKWRDKMTIHLTSYVPFDWAVDYLCRTAPNDASALGMLNTLIEAHECHNECDHYDPLISALSSAFPDAHEHSMSASTRAWLTTLISSVETTTFLEQTRLVTVLAPALAIADPTFLIDTAYSVHIHLAQRTLQQVRSFQEQWQESDVRSWWQSFSNYAATYASDRDVRSFICSSACDHEFFDLSNVSPAFMDDIVKAVPDTRLPHLPTDVLMECSDVRVRQLIMSSLNELLAVQGRAAVDAFASLADDFPGSFNQLISAARLSIG